MSGTEVEIFRSRRRAERDERAFMLAAVGIAAVASSDGPDFLLSVDGDIAAEALKHLSLYENERLIRPPPPPPPPKLHPHALLGSVAYAALLLAVTAFIDSGFWRLDAFDAGELYAARVQAGDWWRVWTALTLHLDAAHLGTNLAAGMWFGFLASRLIGTGNAWLLIVMGAGLANAIEGGFGPSAHRAVGASTAVFTALGLLSAYSWRSRLVYPQRWALRWGPLIAGVILLGWTGTGGEDPSAPTPSGPTVDVVGHALGFVIGAVLGIVAARAAVRRILDKTPQWLMGVLAVGTILVAWARALTS